MDLIEESVSLGVIPEDGLSQTCYVTFHPTGQDVRLIPKGPCKGKCSRVHGFSRGGHTLVYGAILQNRGVIYEVAGSNSGLSDSPVFQKLLGPGGYLPRVEGNGYKRPGQQ